LASSKIQEAFDKRADTYIAAGGRWPWSWLRARERAAMLQMIGRIPGQNVLELGCGAGFYTRLLLECGASWVTAVDQSPAMVAHLPRDRVTGIAGDAAAVQSAAPVDMVLSAGMLEFVPDPVAILKNAKRSIKPGGRLVLLVPPVSPVSLVYWLFHRLKGYSIRLFSARELERVAAESGWRVVAQRYVWPMTLIVELSQLG
jgi:SAM-dependent methyltransferase